VLEDLSVAQDHSVLILEDEVVSGVTLLQVVDGLKEYGPRSSALYLGRRKEDQQVERIAPEIDRVFLAEDHLDSSLRVQSEYAFASYFAS
jgi:hypoxanthine-guanine phosphoribosyltransferase